MIRNFMMFSILCLTVFSFSSCINIAAKKSTISDNIEWQSLFSSMNDTVLWMSSRYPHYPKTGWTYEDGELTLSAGRKGGDLITKKKYSDFELKLEFKLSKLVNSGVKYFLNRMENKEKGRMEWIGFEYQIIDDFSADEIRSYEGPKGSTGALYLIYAPDKDKKILYPEGEWNSIRIVVRGSHIEHWLNGQKVVDANIDTDDFRKLVTETKFINYDDFGKVTEGHILLQDHGDEITFKNIYLLDLSKSK